MPAVETARFRQAGALSRLALWLVLALPAISLLATAQRGSAAEFTSLQTSETLFEDTEEDAESIEPNKDTQQAEGQEGDLLKLLKRIEKLEQAGAKKGDAKKDEKKDEEWIDLS